MAAISSPISPPTKWDYVTIQQASIKSHDFSTYQPHAGFLRDLITKHAPQAKLLIHQTWAYRVDDPRFAVKERRNLASRGRRRKCIAASPPPTTSSRRSSAQKSSPWAMPFSQADTDTTWGLNATMLADRASFPSRSRGSRGAPPWRCGMEGCASRSASAMW
jgi:hypothetical protein